MKTKIIKLTNVALRLGIVLLSLWFLYFHLFQKQSYDRLLTQISEFRFEGIPLLLAVLAVALMPLNLGLEAFKWKLLIDKVEKVKYNRSLTAVFTGISVSMIMPNRVGDYLGRVFILQKGSRIMGMLVTLIGSISQLLTTIIAGSIAFIFSYQLFVVLDFTNTVALTAGVFIASLFSIVLALLLYFNVGLLRVLAMGLFKRRNRIINFYIRIFSKYSRKELLKVLLFSMARYLVFSFQFLLLIWLTGFSCGYFEGMMLIALSYVIITLIPTIALTELSVRGSVALYVFGLYFHGHPEWETTGSIAVFSASLLLWFINLAFPALLGILFVYRLKFFRKKNDDT